jgi:hypothetical protein
MPTKKPLKEEKMAIDLSKIQSKLTELTEGAKGREAKPNRWWSPREMNKQYKIRVFAFPDNDGLPFYTQKVYKNIDDWRPLTAPSQFGLPDPVKEAIDSIYEKRAQFDKDSEEYKECNRQLRTIWPREQHYALVLDRERPEEGLKIWSLAQTHVQKIYKWMTDSDYGDVTDIRDGFDIKVDKSNVNNKTTIDLSISPRPSAAGTDEEVEAWFSDLPDLKEMTPPLEFDKLHEMLMNFINNDFTYKKEDSVGTTRFNKSAATKAESNHDDDDDDEDGGLMSEEDASAKIDKVFASLQGNKRQK